ncbi:hypothetical protein GCM10025857_03920 [Alicyclobacillus contaminans]|nr:hypothetical protein GCM10025857_03920 [Alicyclobacillus contaminans]
MISRSAEGVLQVKSSTVAQDKRKSLLSDIGSSVFADLFQGLTTAPGWPAKTIDNPRQSSEHTVGMQSSAEAKGVWMRADGASPLGRTASASATKEDREPIGSSLVRRSAPSTGTARVALAADSASNGGQAAEQPMASVHNLIQDHAGPKGNTKDVKGNPTDVKRGATDAKGNPTDVKGDPTDVKGNPTDVKGNPTDVKRGATVYAGSVVPVPNPSVPRTTKSEEQSEGLTEPVNPGRAGASSRVAHAQTDASDPGSQGVARQPTLGQDAASVMTGTTVVASMPSMSVAQADRTVGAQGHSGQTLGSPVLNVSHPAAGQQFAGLVAAQVAAGPGELKVHVHPEGLGDILVTVQQQATGVHVRVEGNQWQTVQWLQQQTDGLTQSIRQAGVDLQSVEVSLGQANLTQADTGGSSAKKQRQQTPSLAQVSGTSNGASSWSESFRLPDAASDSRVNLTV